MQGTQRGPWTFGTLTPSLAPFFPLYFGKFMQKRALCLCNYFWLACKTLICQSLCQRVAGRGEGLLDRCQRCSGSTSCSLGGRLGSFWVFLGRFSPSLAATASFSYVLSCNFLYSASIHFFFFQKFLKIFHLLIAALLFSPLLWVYIIFIILTSFLMWPQRGQINIFARFAILSWKILCISFFLPTKYFYIFCIGNTCTYYKIQEIPKNIQQNLSLSHPCSLDTQLLVYPSRNIQCKHIYF